MRPIGLPVSMAGLDSEACSFFLQFANESENVPRVFPPSRSNVTTMDIAGANEVEDRRNLMAHLKGRALYINMIGDLGPLTIASAVDSTVSTPPLLHETMWYCTSFLGREIARHPPAPGHSMVGGRG